MWSAVPSRRPRLNLPLLLGALLLAVTTVVTGQLTHTYSSSSSSGVLSYLPNPRHRMLLGAYTNLAGDGGVEASTQIREAAIGRRYDLELTYYNWTDPFPDFGEATIAAH